MKNILITLIIFCVSFVGGVLMYAIGEKESLWGIWDDPELFKYLSVSTLTVALYLIYVHRSIVWVNKKVKGDLSSTSFYIKRYGYQLLYSGVGSIILSIFISTIIVWFSQEKLLHQTNYFKVDFYIVLVSSLLIQIIYIVIHFMFSWKEYLFNNQIVLLLDDEKYITFLNVIDESRLMLTAGDVDRSLNSELDKLSISLDDIAYIYSHNKVRFVVCRDECIIPYVDLLLEEWISILPSEDFNAVRRDLIVSKEAVVDAKHLKGSRLELVLDPPYKGKTTLSRVATRYYKSWKSNISHNK
ncbi:LytTR family transcriptional regulator DNA-binding domain-containing protein [Sphingobacterium bovisgrunnientis]|uniref:LytTR family transcriptional regulator DNA-binding domain-containing protein n=1 Tax=Sphingobacterium bovisgrunnientis TaxID=1874697 RepID=UPI00135C128B|nr:LytTR family transcriptional regulator DNA-binding domain-containing protein [Sphingobacterium bovisgrunnientis]